MKPTTLTELVDRFMNEEAPRRYRKRGKPTRQIENMQAILMHLLRVEVPAEQLFGRPPTHSHLAGRKTVRALALLEPDLIDRHDLRAFVDYLERQKKPNGEPFVLNTVNKYLCCAQTFFQWASDEDLIGERVIIEVRKVKKVLPGASASPVTPRVQSVPVEHIRDAIAWCREQARLVPAATAVGRKRRKDWLLKALAFELSLLTGMRPGELVQMRPCDLTPFRDVKNDGEYWWGISE